MSKEKIIGLSDGSQYKLTQKGKKTIEDLDNLLKERGIPEEDITLCLAEIVLLKLARNL